MSSDSSDHPVVLVRRDADTCVLAVSGELSLRSAGLVRGRLSKALADPGRVLVDASELQLSWKPAIQLFPSVLAGVGDWPGARLVLFGAGVELTRTLAALRVGKTVPVALDEATARQLLDQRPPVVARHLDLECELSSARRARLFVEGACTDWQLEVIRDDAMVVVSELVANAVVHAATGSRVVLRSAARGLTIAVYDHAPDLALPLRPVTESQRGLGLFMVAALSLHWGLSRGRGEKCVWAFLPTSASAAYSHTVRSAARDAVRVLLAHRDNSADAATAIGHLVARLAERHGPQFLQDVADELVVELAEATAAVATEDEHEWPHRPGLTP